MFSNLSMDDPCVEGCAHKYRVAYTQGRGCSSLLVLAFSAALSTMRSITTLDAIRGAFGYNCRMLLFQSPRSNQKTGGEHRPPSLVHKNAKKIGTDVASERCTTPTEKTPVTSLEESDLEGGLAGAERVLDRDR